MIERWNAFTAWDLKRDIIYRRTTRECNLMRAWEGGENEKTQRSPVLL